MARLWQVWGTTDNCLEEVSLIAQSLGRGCNANSQAQVGQIADWHLLASI